MQIGPWHLRLSLWPTLGFVLMLPILLRLGIWQLDRAAEKQDLLSSRTAQQTTAPLVLNDHSAISEADRYRPARVSGRYLSQRQWLQDNRVRDGQPGYHVYSLLRLDDDRHLLVNRGWIAMGASRSTLPPIPLTAGLVSLNGRLNHPASVGMALGEVDYAGTAKVALVPYLDVAQFARDLGVELMPLVLVLNEGEPGALTPDWIPAERMSPDKHLGYAVQWFGLALALSVIFVVLTLRRDHRSSKSSNETGEDLANRAD